MIDSPDSNGRETAIDRLRGLVMVLMVHDHTNAFFDAQHLSTDSLAIPQPEGGLPLVPFLLRLVTHLCAPTFLFLAGTSLYLSVSKSRARGVKESSIDRHLAIRAAFLLILEVTVVTLCWTPLYGRPAIVLQVLWAIGASLACMILLRRVPVPVAVAVGVLYLVLSDWIVLDVCGWQDGSGPSPFVHGLFVSTSAMMLGDPESGVILVAFYPVFSWLSMLLLGWGFGRVLVRRRESGAPPIRLLVVLGAISLAACFALRGQGIYGDMGLVRRDDSFAQWFHVSKYPPSLTFTLLTLGTMAWILAALLGTAKSNGTERGPLIVFGRTPLFFYVVHLPVIVLLSKISGHDRSTGDAIDGVVAFGVTLAILYPSCLAYARLKRSRRAPWTRYL